MAVNREPSRTPADVKAYALLKQYGTKAMVEEFINSELNTLMANPNQYHQNKADIYYLIDVRNQLSAFGEFE